MVTQNTKLKNVNHIKPCKHKYITFWNHTRTEHTVVQIIVDGGANQHSSHYGSTNKLWEFRMNHWLLNTFLMSFTHWHSNVKNCAHCTESFINKNVKRFNKLSKAIPLYKISFLHSLLQLIRQVFNKVQVRGLDSHGRSLILVSNFGQLTIFVFI